MYWDKKNNMVDKNKSRDVKWNWGKTSMTWGERVLKRTKNVVTY